MSVRIAIRTIGVAAGLLALGAVGEPPARGAGAAPLQDPGTTEQATPARPPAADAGTYRIGPEDLLKLDVFGFEDLDLAVRVAEDGTVSLPLLGILPLGGMTPQEAEAAIARQLEERQLVREPQVSLFVQEYNSRNVYVQGAVERPGVYPMLGAKSLLEMLGAAGGVTGRDAGGAGGVLHVLRSDGSGGQQKIEIDARRLLDEGDPAVNIPLQPGDIVVVPHERTLRVFVQGAVAQPGAVEYPGSQGMTVLQAITAAGGGNERARLTNVRILRTLPDGSQQKIDVDAKKILKGKAPDVPLESNDVVVVGEWFF